MSNLDKFKKAFEYEPYEGEDNDNIIGRRWNFTPEKLWQVYLDYLKWCEEFTVEHPSPKGVLEYNKPRVPYIGGYLNFLGASTDAFFNWRKGKYVKIYREALDEGRIGQDLMNYALSMQKTANRIHEAIFNYKKDALVNGEGSAQGLMFDARVHHGLNDKQVIEHTNRPKIEVEIIDGTGKEETGD